MFSSGWFHCKSGGKTAALEGKNRAALIVAGRKAVDSCIIHNHMVVDSLSATLAALSDPTRRSILARLAGGPATVGELAGPFPMSQQAVSKHLAYLERARLVEKRRQGRRHVCTLRPVPLKEVADWVEHYRAFWEERFDRLEKYLLDSESKESKHGRQEGT
jgi:DNA-binding transcriptional ArsR family regulator